jgi:HNH endonuclease
MKRHTFVFRGKLEHNAGLRPNATHFRTATGKRWPIRKPKRDGIVFGFVNTAEGWAVTQLDEVPLSQPVPLKRIHYSGLLGLGPNGGDIGEGAARLLFRDIVRGNSTLRALLLPKAAKIRVGGLADLQVSATAPDDATDLAEPPKKYSTVVTRVVRDSAMIRNLKALHNDRCQICGKTVTFLDGTTYSEGHHLRPLGGRHKGLDVAGNVIIVCPNCHAACDMAGRLISVKELRTDLRHRISDTAITYHNALVGRLRRAAS